MAVRIISYVNLQSSSPNNCISKSGKWKYKYWVTAVEPLERNLLVIMRYTNPKYFSNILAS